ncbi:MAG: NADH-quinone oxidoreductase subunit L [Deltaproteobacteria bacterium]|nr:NADH-quinone oxidoreductase subunit L [Deltaproteobacteria bacterium]
MLFKAIYLLPLLPAIGVLINGLLGKRFGEKTVAFVACTSVGLSLILAIGILHQMLIASPAERVITSSLYRWISDGSLQINVGFLIDPLAIAMIMVILFVGFIIHFYSIGYMEGEPGYRRFFVHLNLFIFFMLILVMGDNLILTFVGWEGVGLCSYLLIGHWYEKKSASDAGRKAFVVNRVGDFGFMLGIFLVIVTFNTVNFVELKTILAGNHGIPTVTLAIISLLLFTGAVGKSAQFPLHVWLPDAMEGPTPVSALIHAATMVNAGVYFMCRIFPFLQQSQFVLPIIALVGMITAVYAACCAVGQKDIKKVLAYSTISQIGYMFMAVGCGIYVAGMFHLVAHGIFKGLLFLGSGAVIHAVKGEQDIVNMGGLIKTIPVTAITFLIGLLALAGIFPMVGFFSKDAIIMGGYETYGIVYWLFGFGGAILTALYCGKLFGMAFLGESNFTGHVHKPNFFFKAPLVILAVCAVFLGILGIPMFTKNTYFAQFMGSSFNLGAGGHAAAGHGIPLSLEIAFTLILSVFAIAAIVLALFMYSKHRKTMVDFESRHKGLMMFLLKGFWIDKLYDTIWVRPLKWISFYSDSVCDHRIVDGAVNGTGKIAMEVGKTLSRMQTGYVRYYAVSIVFGVFVLVGITMMFLF